MTGSRECRTPFGAPAFKGRGLTGSLGSSFHAKTTTVDWSRLFIGSFNFGRRPAWQNTEIGFVIESPSKAEAIADFSSSKMGDHPCEVRLDEQGKVVWVEQQNGAPVLYHHEPNTRGSGRA